MSNQNERRSGAAHIAVVGAGQIGTPLVARLLEQGHALTWISRTRPERVPEGARHVAIDASDAQALAQALQGTQAVIAAVNPATYDAEVWARSLPALHRGLIDGVGRVGARLVLLDALYLYTTQEGPLSPSTRQAPETEKGKVRKQLADLLAAAQRAGRVRASVLRAPDFWGPDLSAALLTREGLEGLRRGKGPLLLGNPDLPHAFAHRDDVVEALVTLALAGDDVEGNVFHAPVIHPSPRQLVQAFADAFGVRVRPFVAPRWLLRVAGLFSRSTRGLVEMLPQWQAPYLVDDSGYCQRFGVRAISLAEGVARIAQSQVVSRAALAASARIRGAVN